MKTIAAIKRSIEKNEETGRYMVPTQPEHRRMSKENKKLKAALFLLETNPREDFLRAEIERINSIIQSKEDQFKYWFDNVCPRDIEPRKRRAYYNREFGLGKMKEQISFLKFVLA